MPGDLDYLPNAAVWARPTVTFVNVPISLECCRCRLLYARNATALKTQNLLPKSAKNVLSVTLRCATRRLLGT